MKSLLFLGVILLNIFANAEVFNFETYDYLNKWGKVRLARPNAVEREFDAGIDHRIAEITWAPNDYAGGYRAELADEQLVLNETPVYYSFWLNIPSDFQLKEGDSCVLMQFHTPDRDHKPQIAFRARGNGRLDITLNHIVAANLDEAQKLQKKPLKIKNFERGRWHLVEMYIKWSSRSGFINININGNRALVYEGITNYSSQKTGPYFKYGVYPAKNLPYSLTAKFGQYTRIIDPNLWFIASKSLNN